MNIERLQELAGISEGRPGRQKTVELYHGTTSKFLPSIKKHGLLPNTGQQSFGFGDIEGRDAYASYGGVYLTKYIDTAEDAAREASSVHGGEPIVITVQYVLGSGGLDEDYVFDAWFDIVDNVDNPAAASAEALERLAEFTKVRENTARLVREFFDMIGRIKSEKDEYDYDDDIRADPRIRKITKELIQSVKNRDLDNTDNVRVTRPIKFRGKTRITDITQIEKYQ